MPLGFRIFISILLVPVPLLVGFGGLFLASQDTALTNDILLFLNTIVDKTPLPIGAVVVALGLLVPCALISAILSRSLTRSIGHISQEVFASQLFEGSPDAILLIDENGHVNRANFLAEKLFGYEPNGLLGLPADILMSGDFKYHHCLLRSAATEEPIQLQMGVKRELVGMRRDGTEFFVEASLWPMQLQGKQYIVAAASDINDRKRAEEAQQALLTLHAAIQDSALYGIIATDTNGIVTHFNHAAETMLQYSADEMLHKQTPAIFHDLPEVVARAQEFSQALGEEIAPGFEVFVAKCRKNLANEHEWTYIRKDGTHFPVSLSVTALHNAQGEINGFLGVAKDISQQKALAIAQDQAIEQTILAMTKAEAASLAKSDFLANMSHEIRTPMNAIIGLTQIVLDMPLGEKQKQYLSKVKKSSHSLLHILNGILDFSKIESGRLALEEVEFSLEKSLQNVSDLFCLQLEENELELFFELDTAIPNLLVGDVVRLEQVMNNLIGNAIKFTEKGEIRIKAELVRSTDTQVTLRIAVQDSGTGLNKEQADRLFQPFTQADISTTRKYGGTGLGLSICKRLVALMGGEIVVSSQIGKGSTFTFTANFKTAADHLDRMDLHQVSDLKALVLDDQETSLLILGKLLTSWNVNNQTSRSAEEALSLIQQASDANVPFDFVLVDWKMPKLSGLEVIRRIKASVSTGELKRTPTLIMVTAHNRQQLAREAEGIALDGILTKPVLPSHLFDLLVKIRHPTMASARVAQESSPRSLLDISPIRGAYVLLVEDNELNQIVATEFLGKAGLLVSIANNGAEAVEAVKKDHFDAILMDLQMPIMDGFEATRLIRQLPQGKDLPIIAMTAAAMLKDQEATEEAGMNAHVAKPVDPDELAATLLQWIKPTPSASSLVSDGLESSDFPKAIASLEAALPGVSVKSALARLFRNLPLYRKLLRSFAEGYSTAPDDIRAFVIADDKEALHRVAHNFKGLAGNLGFDPIMKCSDSVLLALRTKDEAQLPQLAETLAQECEKTLAALKALPPADS